MSATNTFMNGNKNKQVNVEEIDNEVENESDVEEIDNEEEEEEEDEGEDEEEDEGEGEEEEEEDEGEDEEEDEEEDEDEEEEDEGEDEEENESNKINGKNIFDINENISARKYRKTNFHNSLRNQYINENHPELKETPFEEMNVLTKVVRNKAGNIMDKLHQTIPILTKFERAKVIGLRTNQLNNGSLPLVELEESINLRNDTIAEMELNSKRLPFIISRPIPGGRCEYWKISDLEIVDL